MRAAVISDLAGPACVSIAKRAIPALEPGEVLVRVHGSSVNPADFGLISGRWGPLKVAPPKVLGCDLAGTVHRVQAGSKLKEGDPVFAYVPTVSVSNAKGTWADYAAVDETLLALAPKNRSLGRELGAVPVGSLTAFTALENVGLKAGQRVLIHAGAGGVGSWAVQLAKKHYRAFVVATAGTQNQAFLKELGADECVDYSAEDWVERYASKPFDAIVDAVTGETELRSYKVLAKTGTYNHIMNRNSDQERIAETKARWAGTGQTYTTTVVKPNAALLAKVAEYLEAGDAFQPVAKVYPLEQAREALEELGQWHTRGKIVLTLEP